MNVGRFHNVHAENRQKDGHFDKNRPNIHAAWIMRTPFIGKLWTPRMHSHENSFLSFFLSGMPVTITTCRCTLGSCMLCRCTADAQYAMTPFCGQGDLTIAVRSSHTGRARRADPPRPAPPPAKPCPAQPQLPSGLPAPSQVCSARPLLPGPNADIKQRGEQLQK